MLTRRLMAAPATVCTLLTATPAAAQNGVSLVAPPDRPAEFSTRSLPDFRPPAGDARRSGEPRRNGLIAAWSVSDDLDIGIGRFEIPEPARPRTHMERERNPGSLRPRDRGIAAIGFSLRF